jgi:hypothetical protein
LIIWLLLAAVAVAVVLVRPLMAQAAVAALAVLGSALVFLLLAVFHTQWRSAAVALLPLKAPILYLALRHLILLQLAGVMERPALLHQVFWAAQAAQAEAALVDLRGQARAGVGMSQPQTLRKATMVGVAMFSR